MAAKRRTPEPPPPTPEKRSRASTSSAPSSGKPAKAEKPGKAGKSGKAGKAEKAKTVTTAATKLQAPHAAAAATPQAVAATPPKASPKPAVKGPKSTAKGRSRGPASEEATARHAPADEDEEASDGTEDEAEPIDDTDDESGDAREAPLPIEEDGTEEFTAVPAERALAPARKESLANVDLLQRYMAEVTRYPLLSREDETSLAREFVRTQDAKLAERLVKANLRLVVKIAWEYRRAAFNLLDLVQEGNVGLMQGVKKFDPERGVKLSTYAAWWIRAYIIRFLMDNWRLVKLGTTQAQRKIFFNLRKEKDKLARQGITPDSKLLAESLQVTEQEVIDMDRRLASDDSSLDAPIGDDGGSTMGDRLEGHEPAIDTELAENEIKSLFVHHLDAFARTLEPGGKERYLFDHRLRSDEPKTLQEVGDHFGISRERARQIEARLVQRLKDYMREHLPDFEQLSLNPPDA